MLANSSFVHFMNEYLPTFIARPVSLLFEKLIIVLWFSGIQILIFLAGLQRLDKAIYEAASIDGASPWQTFWKITLPSIKPFILLNVVYTIVSLSFFDMPTRPGEHTILSYIRAQSFEMGGGYGYVCPGNYLPVADLFANRIYFLFLKERSRGGEVNAKSFEKSDKSQTSNQKGLVWHELLQRTIFKIVVYAFDNFGFLYIYPLLTFVTSLRVGRFGRYLD